MATVYVPLETENENGACEPGFVAQAPPPSRNAMTESAARGAFTVTEALEPPPPHANRLTLHNTTYFPTRTPFLSNGQTATGNLMNGWCWYPSSEMSSNVNSSVF